MPRGPEQERLDRIMDALMRFGWLACHFRPGYTSRGYRTPLSGHKGFPDLVAVHKGRGILLFCEVKADRGKLTPEQDAWIEALDITSVAWARKGITTLHVEVCDNDEVERELLGLISGGRADYGDMRHVGLPTPPA